MRAALAGDEIVLPPEDDPGALAAALAGLEPDLRMLATRVQRALNRIEAQFADDPDGYERQGSPWVRRRRTTMPFA